MTLLIPLSYITEACYISDKIDERKMKPNVEEAQEDLRDLLGPEFYEEIESQYPDSLSTDNSTLYEDYLKIFIAWRAYYYSLGFSQSESTPTGEREFKEDNSNILDDVKLFGKEKNIQRRAAKYRNAIVNYIRLEISKDSTKFPLFVDSYKELMEWGISSISAKSTELFKINKTIRTNE